MFLIYKLYKSMGNSPVFLVIIRSLLSMNFVSLCVVTSIPTRPIAQYYKQDSTIVCFE